MTRKEIDLTIKMLEAYSEYHLSPAGCNDTPEDWLPPFTEDERVAINRDFHAANGDPENDDGARPLSDFCYVALMVDKLKKVPELYGTDLCDPTDE